MMTIRPEQCATCIYRPDSPLRDNLPVLEDEIRDPRAPYHFRYARACHSARRAVEPPLLDRPLVELDPGERRFRGHRLATGDEHAGTDTVRHGPPRVSAGSTGSCRMTVMVDMNRR